MPRCSGRVWNRACQAVWQPQAGAELELRFEQSQPGADVPRVIPFLNTDCLLGWWHRSSSLPDEAAGYRIQGQLCKEQVTPASFEEGRILRHLPQVKDLPKSKKRLGYGQCVGYY